MTAGERTMVERVVASRRDLWSAKGTGPIGQGWFVREREAGDGENFVALAGPFETRDQADRECDCMNARAAIAAMREPTSAMLDASWRATENVKPDDRMGALLMSARDAHRVKALNRWRAMLDAALSDDGRRE